MHFRQGSVALASAIKGMHNEVVQVLLTTGVDVNIRVNEVRIRQQQALSAKVPTFIVCWQKAS